MSNETGNVMCHGKKTDLIFPGVYSLFHWIAMSCGDEKSIQVLFS